MEEYSKTPNQLVPSLRKKKEEKQDEEMGSLSSEEGKGDEGEEN